MGTSWNARFPVMKRLIQARCSIRFRGRAEHQQASAQTPLTIAIQA